MKTTRVSVISLLIVGFGLVCGLLAATLALALREQVKLSDITTVIAEDRWPKVELASKVQLEVTDIAIALRNVVIADREATRQLEINEILQTRDQTNADLAELKKRILTPEAISNFTRVEATMRTYRAGQDKLITLVRAGKDEEARQYLNIELKPLLRACRQALTEQARHETSMMDVSRAEAAAAYDSTRMSVLILGGLALIGAVLVATVIVKRLQRVLGGAPEVAAQTAALISKGDLTGAIAVRASDQSSVMYEMEHMREELRRLVGTIREDAVQVSSASAQIAAGNLDLSARTEQQAASLEETAAAMEQLNATVEQNTASAQLANQLAQQAATAAGHGREAVTVITKRMQEIGASTRQMAEIIDMIDSIAFQTNILALNAAVEAARAGDAGRGFAVVATEVRQLAQRSASAAKQIGTLISAATVQAQSGTELVHRTENAMADIVASVAKVEEIMQQIGAASSEQHAGIVACSRAVSEMDEGTQQNSVLVEQVATAAQSLKTKSEQLTRAVSRFRIEELTYTGKASATPLPSGAEAAHDTLISYA